ncbi:hypothetical protein [uncultured Leuconostoc sp.]|uniref:hypothetical protein n=1 Tax=uncultured Leuconostoc sp. TaxID=173262 RepID=UPI0025EA745C|nr:hypothetical protein [uncultured Leuconostoc sp.]
MKKYELNEMVQKYKLTTISNEELMFTVGGSNDGFWTGFGYVVGKTARGGSNAAVYTYKHLLVL